MSKTHIRHDMLVKRLAIPELERVTVSVDFMRKTLAYLKKKHFHSVAGYFPIKGEIDVLPLLEALHDHGMTCALPIIPRQGHVMHFRRWHPGMKLGLDKFGIGEPPESAHEVVPDVMIVPLLAYDKGNHRIGYGGGYYDATIAEFRKQNPVLHTVGCAYKWQKLVRLPVAELDTPLDKIIAV